jgi:hypothetical protein
LVAIPPLLLVIDRSEGTPELVLEGEALIVFAVLYN